MTTQEKVHYAVANTSLGQVLVARSDWGVRAILLGQTLDQLLSAVRSALQGADISHSLGVQGLADEVARHIEDPNATVDLKLDLRGNAFQLKVWHALRTIPAGTTISYGELAKTIGAPGAARAVGEACATNIVAVLVPCHRVVKSDGKISGYRWGVETKRRLLDRESAQLRINAIN